MPVYTPGSSSFSAGEIKQIKADVANKKALIASHEETISSLRSKGNSKEIKRDIEIHEIEKGRLENEVKGLKNWF